MPRPPKYTDEELLEEIRRLSEKLNRVPRKRDMNDYGKHGARTYQDRWGRWSSAVEAAGFEPRKKGTGYRTRPDTCPLCGIDQTGLDFHHWRYGENEIGCYLCRDCHDDVHKGDASTENPGWLVQCVKNLVRLHIENHGSSADVEQILERYNLPDVGIVVSDEIDARTR